MPKILNGTIVTDDYGDKCLFGDVYEDSRYKYNNGTHIKDGRPTGEFADGNHILTSKIEKIEGDTIITRTGTVYNVVNMMDTAEMIKHIEKTYCGHPHYKEYLLSKIK